MMTENKAMPYILTVVSGILGGMNFLQIKIAAPYIGTVQILAARWLIALIFMTILIGLGVIRVNLRGKSLKPLLLVVLINPCFSGICDATGVALTTATEAAIFLALMPFFVAVLSRMIKKTRIHPLSLFAMFAAVFGLVLTKVFDASFALGGNILGYLLLFINMVAWGFYTILTGDLQTDFTATEVTYFMAVSGAIWYNALGLIRDQSLTWFTVSLQEPQVALALVTQGVFTGALGFLLLNYALGRMPAAQNNMIYINVFTLTGVLTGIIVLHDSFGWYTIVGLLILVAAVILFNVPMLRQNRPAAQTTIE